MFRAVKIDINPQSYGYLDTGSSDQEAVFQITRWLYIEKKRDED